MPTRIPRQPHGGEDQYFQGRELDVLVRGFGEWSSWQGDSEISTPLETPDNHGIRDEMGMLEVGLADAMGFSERTDPHTSAWPRAPPAALLGRRSGTRTRRSPRAARAPFGPRSDAAGARPSLGPPLGLRTWRGHSLCCARVGARSGRRLPRGEHKQRDNLAADPARMPDLGPEAP